MTSNLHAVGQPVEPLTQIQRLERELNAVVLERGAEIRSMLLGMLTGQPVLLLGAPGCGKSFQGQALAQALPDARSFRVTFSKSTEPERIRGPMDPKEFMQGRYVYNTSGMMPEAQLVIGDELFKANKAALTELTDILCDRQFLQAGQPQACAWRSFLATSNEMPEDDSLAFIWDRFVLRHKVRGLVSEASRRAAILSRSARPAVVCTMADIESDAEIVASEPYDPELVDKLLAIQDALVSGRAGVMVNVSDRRVHRLLDVGRANMVAFGESVGDTLERLIAGLWDSAEQIPAVTAAVTKIANPERARVQAILDSARETLGQMTAVHGAYQLAATAEPGRQRELKSDALGKFDALAQRLEAEREKLVSSRGSRPQDIEEINALVEAGEESFQIMRRWRPDAAGSDT